MERDIPAKVARFVFGTGYGAPAVCAAAGAAAMAAMLLLPLCPDALFYWCGPLFLLSLLVLAAAVAAMPLAFVWSLAKRRWGHAAAQLVLGLLAALFCVIGLPAAFVGSWAVADKWGRPEPWMEAKKPNGLVPFEVEYRDCSIFDFSEHVQAYDRRVVFPSGKRVELARDRGGSAELEVYPLGGEAYALEDRAGYHCRVDAADESVRADTWDFPSEGVAHWYTRGDTRIAVMEDGREEEVRKVPPYDPLPEPRRPLGRFCPPGRFVPAKP